MLSSKAHVSIDGEEFMLDTSQPEPYQHRFIDVTPDGAGEIVGGGKHSAVQGDDLFWTYTDWAGGEGNRNYDPNEPDTYDVAQELNPRIRGQITGRPNRVITDVTVTDCRDKPFFAVGDDGVVFMAQGIDLFYSSAPQTSFTQLSDANQVKLTADYKITALTADDRYCYFSAWKSASTTRLLRFCNTGSVDGFVEAATTGKSPFLGLAMQNGKLYSWTGRKLYSYDLATLADGYAGLTLNETFRKVGDAGEELVNAGSCYPMSNSPKYWGGLFATDNSLIAWSSTPMQSHVYEFKKGVMRPIWNAPYGYTIKDGAFTNGTVIFTGHWDADAGTAGYGQIWALPLDSYRPFAAKWVRRSSGGGTAMTLAATSASYGSQIVTAATHTGRLYVYDLETDGLTMLDHLNDAGSSDPDGLEFTSTERIGDTITYGAKRLVAIYSPGAAAATTRELQVAVYDDDETGNIEAGLNSTDYANYAGLWRSGSFDMGYPFERKTLVGFRLSFFPLVANQTLKVEYNKDENGWTTAATLTSADTGATEGNYFIKLGTVNFTRLNIRMTLSSTSTAVPPIVYSITTQARLARRREQWHLKLRTKDESDGTRSVQQKGPGSKYRDEIIGTADIGTGGALTNGKAVTFLDGWRYKDNNKYTTHSVIVKSVNDVVEKPGEGVMYVVLEKVPASGKDGQ